MASRRGGGGARAELLHLARLYGVQGSYTDQRGRTVRTGSAPLLATLRALGADVERPQDVGRAVGDRLLELASRVVEPVALAWNGRLAPVRIRLPSAASRRRAEIVVEDEGGGAILAGTATLHATGGLEVGRRRFVEHELLLPPALAAAARLLPFGYHGLTLRVGPREESTMVVSAPRAAVDSAPGSWGVFLPLYALRTRDCWGVGDLGDLLELATWTAGLGGDLVATLPLLPAFLDDRPVFEPSPYSPVSRLFWNELYADLDAVPAPPRVAALLRSPAFRRGLARLRSAPIVDYAGTMALKRRVLEALASHEPGQEPGTGRAADYAAFRANAERRGTTWWTWPEAEREGRLPRFGGDRDSYRYHLFAQRLMEGQMAETARRARAAHAGLYFDLPVGVHPDGYDVWREREAFVLGVSAGSPPDIFFSRGQDWGFPPAHPEGDRRNGYRYFRSCIEHLFRHASVARIDHCMGLHRMFVVPAGMSPGEGAYVRYRPEELYAILALESHRHGTVVVGEDLGTVPAAVRSAMRAHGIHRSHVMEFVLSADRRRAIAAPPERSLASLDTHDTPTFAAFWRGLDVRLRLDEGWIDEADARRELRYRERLRRAVVAYLLARGRLPAGRSPPSLEAVLRAALAELAAGPPRMVVTNLEDLWLETLPQNVPGTTGAAYPNWRRPARFTFEEFSMHRSVVRALRTIEGERAARRRPT
jgi:4-alpha-glucanotransferase